MTKVRALKTKDDANRVNELLKKHYTNSFSQIWRFALNVGLRMGDVLNISMEDAKKSLATNELVIKEQKTGKYNIFEINAGGREIIRERISDNDSDQWLFQSHAKNARHLCQPITRQAIYTALREVGNIMNVKLGTHSARKTRARIMYEQGVPIEKISSVLNHSNIKETMTYLDITQDEKNKTYHELVF